MPLLRGALLAILLLVGAVPLAEAQTEPTLVYLVRHAERLDEAADTPLSEAGHERAQALAHLLRDAGITRIFSTGYARTRQTAAPLAETLGVSVEPYDPSTLAAFADSLRQQPGRVLVVGHSNTTPDLVRHLGGTPDTPIEHDEYDRLYLVVLHAGQVPVTTLLRYAGR